MPPEVKSQESATPETSCQEVTSSAIKTRIVSVAVPCPLYRTFDYQLANSLAASTILPGMRVRVSFGRQKLVAIILEEKTETDVPAAKLKPVSALLDSTSVISPEIFKLLTWAARYYVHPLGDVMQTALPVYLRSNEDAMPALTDYWRFNTDIVDATGSMTVDAVLDTLKHAPKQQQILQMLIAADDANGDQSCDQSLEPGLDAESLNAQTENWRPAIRALLQKNLIEHGKRPAVLTTSSHSDYHIELNQDQSGALSAILQHEHQHAVHVLNGITGSGKTEVYLALCKDALTANRQVLILVPEIGLTPQLTQRFLQQLDTSIVVLHSAMHDKQRYAAWHAAASGQARLVIGTRSSVFTPLPELGLIIVDEEHDGSYKQQDGFRYNARDLAIVRARNNDIPIVLGSATPSLETLNNINEHRYEVHYLKQRANKKPLPAIRLINLCSQKLQEGMADTLLSAIRQHLQQQGQVLLFINRRGFAPLLMCHDCGWTTSCHRCDAHMTFHKRRNQLRCHHCGSQRPAPDYCEDCGSSNVLAIGAGTERIEQFLQSAFPDTLVSRIDRDSTRSKGSLEEKLRKAHSGESGILVGTQMLAKGHDFPNLTLVCILDTDQALFSADFRAAEHLAQLITQVSGRAGRADKQGQVLIQTHHPDHPLLQTLLHHGYTAFAEAALKERRTVGLPPIRHLALLRCESVASDAAQAFLEQAVELANKMLASMMQTSGMLSREQLSTVIDIYGPLPAPMEKRAGRYRYQLMLQSAQRKPLNLLLSNWAPQLQQLATARKVRWSLDVDPYDTF